MYAGFAGAKTGALLSDITAMDGGNSGIAGANSFQQAWQRIADNFDVLFTTEQSVEKLKQTPEGGGTMFDHTMIMYFPENGETHHGIGSEAPFLIMSGSNCNLDIAGRYIRLPYLGNEGHKTLGNWYTTLLNAHGNPIEHYGDLDLEMSRKKLHQTGPIKQLMG